MSASARASTRPSRVRRASITSGTTTEAAAITPVVQVKSASLKAGTMPIPAPTAAATHTTQLSLPWKANSR